MNADLVVLDGDVRTQDPANPVTDAVAVRGDRIVALGGQARALASTAEAVIEARSGTVLPGFVDAHVHPVNAGLNLVTVDLAEIDSVAGYLDRIAEYLTANPGDGWVTGGGWNMELFPGGLPRRDMLDTVTGDRPVFLFNRDVHGAWVNSAALRRGGITAATTDPADGRIERDPDGTPTGCLHEGAAYRFRDEVVPAPTAELRRDALRAAISHLHGLGVTGWQDAWVTPEIADTYTDLVASGELHARVRGALWWETDRGLDQIDDFITRRDALAGSIFTAGTVKIMVDGVLENRTGAMLEPYTGCGCDTGMTRLPTEELEAAVVALDRHGFQVHLHAIGDRAVRIGLDAFAAARKVNGADDSHRHHLAHLQVVHPDDIPRFAALGVTANAQAYWARYEQQMIDLTLPILGGQRSGWQYPFADLVTSGAHLAMGSDWPVSTADPLQQLEVAVFRRSPDDRDEPRFLPGQSISLDTALAAFTRGSARINHDDDAGVLSPGLRADLVVLDRNLHADPEHLADARVTHTVVAGRLT